MRGLGWLPDVYDPRDLSFGLHHPEGSVAATKPDITEFWPGALDQGAKQSCVPHAGKQAIRMAMAIDGKTGPDPSVNFGWNAAQAEEHSGRPFGDRGCYIRNYLVALERCGWVTSDADPYDPNGPCVPPTALAYTQAFGARGSRFYRLTGYGDGRIEELRRALQARMPVLIGMRVDYPFLRADGPDVVDQIDTARIAGGHAMCVLAVRDDGAVLLGNSWGRSWRRDGMVWLAKDVVTTEHLVSDLWALSLIVTPPASDEDA